MSSERGFTGQLRDLALLGKPRLASLVVMSAAFCFVLGSESGQTDWPKLLWLILGGFLVTVSSNGFNQVWEKGLDALMERTKNRPLPALRMSPRRAVVFSSLCGLGGLMILFGKMGILCGVLGLFALLSYVLVYTPLKTKTPFAVFVGAFPGAIPPMLGWAAASGQIGLEGFMLFAIQFIWQFPHFWAIAWMLEDDYKKAGFRMLPSMGGRDKSSAFQILVYTLLLVPVSLTPWMFGLTGNWSAFATLLLGIVFLYQAWQLFTLCSMEAARKLMFGSFLYLPLVQLVQMFDKV